MESSKPDPFALPPPERLREIERLQNERAREIAQRRAQEQQAAPGSEAHAAQTIQKNYRGYRTRRALKGHGLDPSTRWVEALKDVEYRRVTKPMSRNERTFSLGKSSTASVRDRWRRVGSVLHHAGSDNTSESEANASNEEERAKQRERRRNQKRDRERFAKVMGLEYFLEMVDHKHRYGSNLRRYHAEWKNADTTENFFYWLDYGEGKDVDLEDRPRARLDTEQVRYLSREERHDYLARIDDRGRFVWNKNGQPITTSPHFRDSMRGIVPVGDHTATWQEVREGAGRRESAVEDPHDAGPGPTTIGTGEHVDPPQDPNGEPHKAEGVDAHDHGVIGPGLDHAPDKKGADARDHRSASPGQDHEPGKPGKKNTWIFVADTSFRLYVGIKQSGAFQHSSFLKGARVSAAGQIKIERGQIRQLSPLSGHYAPPVRNFREFVRSLRDAHADLSRLNVSRSYAVILGVEGYLTVKNFAKDTKQGVWDLLHPHEKRRREEDLRDKTESAEKERRAIAAAAGGKDHGLGSRIKPILGRGHSNEG